MCDFVFNGKKDSKTRSGSGKAQDSTDFVMLEIM